MQQVVIAEKIYYYQVIQCNDSFNITLRSFCYPSWIEKIPGKLLQEMLKNIYWRVITKHSSLNTNKIYVTW